MKIYEIRHAFPKQRAVIGQKRFEFHNYWRWHNGYL